VEIFPRSSPRFIRYKATGHALMPGH